MSEERSPEEMFESIVADLEDRPEGIVAIQGFKKEDTGAGLIRLITGIDEREFVEIPQEAIAYFRELTREGKTRAPAI